MSLRLVKVIVQPVYVWDDGDSLREMQGQPITVNAAEWPDYPATLAERAKAQEDALAAQFNGKATPYGDAVAADYHDVAAVSGE